MWKPWITTLALSGLVVGRAAAADSGVPLVQSVPHIVTTGYASADVVPDQADMVLGIENERPTTGEASDATAKAAAEVIAAIKAQGVDARDINTAFSLTAVYDEGHDPHGQVTKRVLRGYQADERVTIRVRDVAKVGALTRMALDRGANTFRGVEFSYSKERSKRRELEGEAIRDALAEAKVYTDAIGAKLGRPLEIGSDAGAGAGGVADRPMRAAMRSQSAAPVVIPTEPGTQTIATFITVIWEIRGSAP